MFSYVDRRIRGDLERTGRLFTVDEQGKRVDQEGSGDPYLSILGPVPLPRIIGSEERILRWYAFVRRVELAQIFDVASRVKDGDSTTFRELLQNSMAVSSLLVLGDPASALAPLVRIHSCCLTGDVFGSLRCDCGPQLAAAFERIASEGTGIVVYMSGHEGRGIGLWAKAVTYLLQDDGQNTYEANVSLGLPEDSRDFKDAAVALRFLLGGRPIRLLSNNPVKRDQLERAGQPVAETIPVLSGVNRYNLGYLRAKRRKGHSLPEI